MPSDSNIVHHSTQIVHEERAHHKPSSGKHATRRTRHLRSQHTVIATPFGDLRQMTLDEAIAEAEQRLAAESAGGA